MDTYNIYKDIQARTRGEIYIGVVGPVRTGKSTFVRRFMELAALPNMEETAQKEVRDHCENTSYRLCGVYGARCSGKHGGRQGAYGEDALVRL